MVHHTVSVRVLVFGSLRERLRMDERALTTSGTVADVWTQVAGTSHAPLGLRVARNQVFCAWDAPVDDGDEVAFMPPVSGG